MKNGLIRVVLWAWPFIFLVGCAHLHIPRRPLVAPDVVCSEQEIRVYTLDTSTDQLRESLLIRKDIQALIAGTYEDTVNDIVDVGKYSKIKNLSHQLYDERASMKVVPVKTRIGCTERRPEIITKSRARRIPYELEESINIRNAILALIILSYEDDVRGDRDLPTFKRIKELSDRLCKSL